MLWTVLLLQLIPIILYESHFTANDKNREKYSQLNPFWVSPKQGKNMKK
jgi:hypothetical protein